MSEPVPVHLRGVEPLNEELLEVMRATEAWDDSIPAAAVDVSLSVRLEFARALRLLRRQITAAQLAFRAAARRDARAQPRLDDLEGPTDAELDAIDAQFQRVARRRLTAQPQARKKKVSRETKR